VTNLALLGLFAALIRLGIAPVTASIAGYLIGVLVTYLINRTWSFESSRSHVIGGAGYFGVHACGIATVAGLQAVVHGYFGVPALLVQIFAVGLVAATSFILFDRIVFPRQHAATAKRMHGSSPS
jgi:putative flippase GtrA